MGTQRKEGMSWDNKRQERHMQSAVTKPTSVGLEGSILYLSKASNSASICALVSLLLRKREGSNGWCVGFHSSSERHCLLCL